MYSVDEKVKALNLIRQFKKIVEVVKTTSISKSTLYRWRKEMIEKNKAEKEIREKKTLSVKRNKLIGEKITQFKELIKNDESQANLLLVETKDLIKLTYKEYPNPYTIGHAIKLAKIQGNTSQIVTLIKKLLEFEPDNGLALYELYKYNEILYRDLRNKYNEIKDSNNLEAKEKILRKFMKFFPEDFISQNQLAGILLTKLEREPSNKDLITETRTLLFRLRKVLPTNGTVKSNIIKLEKICHNEDAMISMLRELISLDEKNYKAKCQLARILVDKYKKDPQAHNQSIILEANRLVQEVLFEYPNNQYAMGQSTELARLKRDLCTEESLLRKNLELDPNNCELKTRLAGTLLEVCIDKVNNNGNIDKRDPLLIEAKNILLERFKEDPRNLYVITYLIRVANLQSKIGTAINLLKLKVDIDPNDIEAKEYLQKLVDKVKGHKISEAYEDKKAQYNMDNFIPEDFSKPVVKKVQNNNKKGDVSKSYTELYRQLLSALEKGWDPLLISDILNKMLVDESISEGDKRKINSMLSKTKSNKAKMLFSLREDAKVLLKRFY